MPSASDKKSHHHGDLQQALIMAGVALLDEGGLPNLTLRKCAARAGVSHAAPAHHFSGLRGLLTAIVAHGFELFSDTMIAERTRAAADPKSKLMGIANGYVKFSTQNAALSELMFMSDRLDTELPRFQKQSSRSYQILVQGCAPFDQSKLGPGGLESLIWSLVQGYAHLVRNHMLDQTEHPLERLISAIDLKLK